MGSHDNTNNYSSKLSMKAMMAKLLKGVGSTNMGVKKMKSDLSTISPLVDSYSTSMKKLEHQISQLSTIFNLQKSGTLPSTIVQTL